jgi:Fe2+ or Zn2+ uptake regulation protein
MHCHLAKPCGIITAVTDSDSPAMRRLKQATANRKRAVTAERVAILEALAAGEKQGNVANVIGRSREHIRLLVAEEAKRRQR